MMPGNCIIESEIFVWILDEFGSFFSLFPSIHCRTDAFRFFFWRKESAVIWKVIVWLSFAIRIGLPITFFTSKYVVEFVYVLLFIKTIKSYGNRIFVVSFFVFISDRLRIFVVLQTKYWHFRNHSAIFVVVHTVLYILCRWRLRISSNDWLIAFFGIFIQIYCHYAKKIN